MLLKRLIGAAVAAGGLGLAAWARPSFTSFATPEHAPPTPSECAALRWVRSGQSVDAAHNPGCRVTPNFLSPEEAAELLQIVHPMLGSDLGFSTLQRHHAALYRFQMSGLVDKPPPVNMRRVTGRPEVPFQQVTRTWQYRCQRPAALPSAAPPPCCICAVLRAALREPLHALFDEP